MSILRFLWKRSGKNIALVSLIGFLGGVCSAALIALINFTLHNTSVNALALAALFLALVAVKILASALSQTLLYRFSQRVMLGLSLDLSEDLARSSLRQAEAIGPSKMMAILAEDVQGLTFAIQSVPALLVNLAVLAGCSLYLIWLSWKAFLILCILAGLGVAAYRLMLGKTQLFLQLVREKRDTLFSHFRSLTEGLKEIRINRARRQDLFTNHISKTIEELNVHGLTAIRHYVFTDSISQLVFYGILGLLLFALPMVEQMPLATLTGYVFAALYIMGPVWGVIYTLPTLQRGQISLERIEQFRSSLLIEPESPMTDLRIAEPWQALQFQNVVFSYGKEDPEGEDHSFALGPIDFELKPGELVFVIGGNGSGKSTFVKLLCGLYVPKSGNILLNGRMIQNEDREEYRQHFSVVFSDFFLFDTILGLSDSVKQEKINEYLRRLQLDTKVTIENGRFSTTALSQGQRRRLALLTAYLEDHPIYIFDEWAADQDPAYKEVFYKTLLPELKSQGKAVVVITHDDRYFGVGDRVVHLDYGRIKKVSHHKSVQPAENSHPVFP